MGSDLGLESAECTVPDATTRSSNPHFRQGRRSRHSRKISDMHPTSILGGLLALAALPAFAATAPTTPSLNIPRVGSDITVDGVLDEPVWAEAAMVDVSYEVSPGDNLPAPVKTTARIAYTEDAVLLAFRAEDPDPSKLRAFLRDRDALYSDDFVGVMLDTFDDQRRAYEFFVNPLGVQADLIKEEAAGNEDDSWDGLWTSAALITAQGYDVELRIPFATLRFENTDGARRCTPAIRRAATPTTCRKASSTTPAACS